MKKDFIVWLIFTLAFGSAIVYGLGKQEVIDCLKWQKYAQEYPGFYLLRWQKIQCETLNIEISAYIAKDHNDENIRCIDQKSAEVIGVEKCRFSENYSSLK